VVVFDPFLESPPEGICGDIDCGTGVYIDPKPANQSGVIYPDGVFQQIMPAVVSPGAFTKTVRRAVPADNIASNVNGSFGMSYQGKAPHLTPKFGSHARSLAPKERIEPAVAIQADGAALQYTHQSGNQAITTPVSISPPIQPRVHNPQAFIDKVMEFEVVDNVTLNADGSFDVFYGGQTVQKYMIAPTFEIQSIPLSAPIEPSLGVDTEGKVVYTLQVQGNAVAAKLTASLITADVPSLDVFLAMVRGFPGVEITQNADSSFTVLLLPDLYFLVTPTFEFQIKDIIPGEILPAIVGHPDGSVTYTVQQQGTQQAITTKLLVRPIDAP
ncbi:MAG: hypothetical protein GY862_35590, partial [Gammaproteobacteria bacterium]|nr:hypothetical protein [Gammaproteobacteria bacterium]